MPLVRRLCSVCEDLVIDFGPRLTLHSPRQRYSPRDRDFSTCLDQQGGPAAGAGRALCRGFYIAFEALSSRTEPVGQIVRDVVRRWRIRVPVLFANESLNGRCCSNRVSRDRRTLHIGHRCGAVFGMLPIRARADYVLVVLLKDVWLPVDLRRIYAAILSPPITSHRTSATTLSAAGVGSDNSAARVMSSIECSVMYFE